MKNYMLMLAVLSIFLISSCSQQPQQAEPPAAPDAPGLKVIAPVEKIAESSPAAADSSASDKPGNAEGKTAAPDSNVKEFDMTARKWAFEPSTIAVKEGDKVIINIKSEDVAHGFAIFEFDVNEKILPGETTRVEFVADKKGEYVFFCSVPCGQGHGGMNGKLIVE